MFDFEHRKNPKNSWFASRIFYGGFFTSLIEHMGEPDEGRNDENRKWWEMWKAMNINALQ